MKIQFRSREVLVVAMAIIAAQASTVIFGIDSGWLRLLSVVVMAGIYIVAIDYLLQRQDASYTKRIEANESSQWDVWMNGVKVGWVADAEYAAKQQIAFRDGLNALSQLINAGHVAMNVLGKLFISVPSIVFWGALALLFSHRRRSRHRFRNSNKRTRKRSYPRRRFCSNWLLRLL